MVGVLGGGVGYQLVAPVHKLLSMFVGHPEEPAQHTHGQHTGHLAHEVELAEGQGLVQDAGRELPDGLLIGVDGLAGEAPVDQPPKAGVVRRVALHHRPPGLSLLGIHFLQPDPLIRGEVLAAAVEFDDVRVPGDGPKAGAVDLVDPGHRILVT